LNRNNNKTYRNKAKLTIQLAIKMKTCNQCYGTGPFLCV
jgi:hypothetical protein